MDCLLSNTAPFVATPTAARLQSALWHRDWDDAAQLASQLERESVAPCCQDLRAQLHTMVEMLATARGARAELQAALGRVQAVATLTARQNVGETPDS